MAHMYLQNDAPVHRLAVDDDWHMYRCILRCQRRHQRAGNCPSLLNYSTGVPRHGTCIYATTTLDQYTSKRSMMIGICAGVCPVAAAGAPAGAPRPSIAIQPQSDTYKYLENAVPVHVMAVDVD